MRCPECGAEYVKIAGICGNDKCYTGYRSLINDVASLERRLDALEAERNEIKELLVGPLMETEARRARKYQIRFINGRWQVFYRRSDTDDCGEVLFKIIVVASDPNLTCAICRALIVDSRVRMID